MPATTSPVTGTTPGPIHILNNLGSQLNPGQVVTLQGWNTGLPTPILADRTVAGARAQALVMDAIANGATGYVYPCDQIISGVNVGAASVGDAVYLGTAGGFAFTTAPSGRGERIGIVTSIGAAGSIYLFPTALQILQAVGSTELASASVAALSLIQPTTLNGQVTGAGSKLIRARYDFTVAGGAQGTLALLQTVGGLGATPIPANTVITGGFLRVITPPTGVGASIALQVEAANDLVAVAAISGEPWSVAEMENIVPDESGEHAILTTVARDVSMVITGANLTAGVFDVFMRAMVIA